ncbi:T6SS effector BTH_I2691 family protein [Cobetia sp. 10Alg 146]|uniref:T6SS effector BTH_I2691 family protein n=1 Tax=Cobetia sp. 10Alg 146 TaxID=3040019 RepID=UPI0024478752|nr:T6SS effector BTH_I2691 family protein [Cobetia sp. 10Alg 146]MDH2291466.1 T6SS effector BTH_I2691 family protein [Cobetia sp. 10Alg 146]
MSGQIVNQHVALSVVNGECRFCKRTGFPILPVRYAVCQRNDANQQIPELSEDRVKAFTDIKLDQTLENGKRTTRVVPSEVKEEIAHSTSSQVNKYILRQLRSGYLYLFDKDNPDGMYWSAFAITADGKYYQFPVKQPPSLDKMAMPCTLESGNRDGESDEEKVTRVKNESLQASLVTITTPDKSGDVYYAYTEHAWPEGFLDEVKSRILSGDPWCDKYLQKFNVPDWKAGVAQDHAFSLEELDQVAEYSPGAAGLDEQFWSSGPKRDLYSPEEMKQTMSERLRYASTDYEGRGLILAVNDEIGIIQELNAYRHQALAAIDEYFDPEKGNEERRRMKLCSNAIKEFKDSFATSYKLVDENRPKVTGPASVAKQIDYDILKSRQESTHENFNEQIDRIYDSKALIEFDRKYKDHTRKCDFLMRVHDDDYAQWLYKYSQSLVPGCFFNNLEIGGLYTDIVSRLIKGGILSPASASCWKELTEDVLKDDSFVISVLFMFDKDLIADASLDTSQLSDGTYLDESKLLKWLAVFDAIFESCSYQTKNKEELYETIINSQSLNIQSIGYSFVYFLQHSVNVNLYNSNANQIVEEKALDKFMKLVQMSCMAGGNASSKEVSFILLERKTVTLSNYEEWLHDYQDKIINSSKKKAENFKSEPASNGGKSNIPLLRCMSGTSKCIEVVIPTHTLKQKDNINQAYSLSNDTGNYIEYAGAAATVLEGITEERITSSSYGKIVPAVLAMAGVALSVSKNKVEGEEIKFHAIVSNIASIGAASIKLAEGVSAHIPANSWASFSLSTRWTVLGNFLGRVSGLIALYDIVDKFDQANSDKHNGRAISEENNNMMASVTASATAVGLIAGYLIAGVMASLLVGAVIAFAVIAIGINWYKTYVPGAVETWISRSFIGYDTGGIQKYENASSELNGLNMVFSGIEIEFYIKDISSDIDEDVRDQLAVTLGGELSVYYIVEFVIKTPDMNDSTLSIQYISLDKAKTYASINLEYTEDAIEEVKGHNNRVLTPNSRSSTDNGIKVDVSNSNNRYVIGSKSIYSQLDAQDLALRVVLSQGESQLEDTIYIKREEL